MKLFFVRISSRYFVFFLLVVSCIEPIDFVIEDDSPTLVVEAFISDKSYDESLGFPSDGRYFTVKMNWTTKVSNVRPAAAAGALVTLESNEGDKWQYTEAQPGTYELQDDFFEASPGIEYRLVIAINGEVYESSWEKMPDNEPLPMGDISFVEATEERYVMFAEQPKVTNVKVMKVQIALPQHTSGSPIYYLWRFDPTYIYRAPLTSVIQEGHLCYVNDSHFIRNYALQNDLSGGYQKDLFTLETIRNKAIYEKLSVLISQYVVSEDQYYFLKEMFEQTSGSLLDKPPFNLNTNLKNITSGKRVSGYFGVVREQATRWNFNRKELSYTVVDTNKADCNLPYLDPGPECLDCREYPFGKPVNVKPWWWDN